MRSVLRLMLFVLLTSCGSNSRGTTTPTPITKCQVPERVKRPVIDPQVCGDKVCITVNETVALAAYLHASREVDDALEGCSLIERVAQ
jgi:hypothetical protein